MQRTTTTSAPTATGTATRTTATAATGTAAARRDFRLFWTGDAVNQLGSRATDLALPLLVLAIGGAPLLAGIVGTVSALAGVLVTPVAGVVADRVSRRALMVGAALVAAGGSAIVLIGFAGGVVSVTLLLLTATGVSVAGAFATAATRAATRMVLPGGDRERALSVLQARDQGASLAGPPLGGALYQLAPWAPFALDTVSYLASAACLRAIGDPLTPPPDPAEASGPPAGLRRRFADGLRFIAGQPVLRFAITWAAGINLVYTGLQLAVVLRLGQDGASPVAISLTMTAAGAAGLLGALAAPRLLRRVPADLLVITVSWLMVGAVLPLTVLRSPWAAAALLGAVAALTPALSIAFRSRTIGLTPEHLQGRVGTALVALGEGAGAGGPLLAGAAVSALAPAAVPLPFAAGLALLAGYAGARAGRLITPGRHRAVLGDRDLVRDQGSYRGRHRLDRPAEALVAA